MSMFLNDDTYNGNHHANCISKVDLIAWCKKLHKDCKAEADYSGMFSGSYWEGKADAFAEVLNYLAGH